MKPNELDALLGGLDESLQPLDGEEAKKAADAEKSADELKAEEQEAKKDETNNEEELEAEPALDKDGNPIVEDEGITVGEFESEDKEEAKDEKKPEVVADTSSFNPEQRFIYDGLNTVRTVGKDGKIYDVKTNEELPNGYGFEFADKATEKIFDNAMTAQENNARDLQQQFRGKQAEAQNADFTRKEQLADKIDLNELQEAGDFPRFKIKPNEKGFEASEPALLITEILEYKEELNKAAYERAQKNGTIMRVVGFKEAYDLYRYYDKGEKKADNTKKADAQKNEDKQRRDVASRTNKANGSAAKGSEQRPALYSKRDIDDYIDSLDS
jgi:hypothetical protein